MFERILIAVNDGGRAAAAAEAGFAMARATGGVVALLHVAEPAMAYAAEVAYVDERTTAAAVERGRTLLEETRAKYGDGVECEVLVRQGFPADEIVAAAAAWKAQLIVLGTHARGRVGSFILGSTAVDVLHRAHCPVLVERHPPGAGGAGDAAAAGGMSAAGA